MSTELIGYTSGVFDLFHIGHINILRNSKALCDKLVVGVTPDDLVEKNKNKKAVIPFNERLEIIRSIKYVDLAIQQPSYDKKITWEKLKFDILFVGDDWFNNSNWKEYEIFFSSVNVKVVYFPYTKNTSSTLINNFLLKQRDEKEFNDIP